MSDQETKTCKVCAETIKAAAKLCPHCRHDQRRGVLNPIHFNWVAWPFLLLIAIGCLTVFSRLVLPGKDFSKVRDQISVTSSSMQFSSGVKGRYITTVGMVSNASNYAWKDVQMEVRYLNQEGKLVDVGSEWFSDVVIQPRSESAFKIRTLADQEESAYASHKVVVRTARDINRWP